MLLRDKEANRLTLPLGRRSESTALKHPPTGQGRVAGKVGGVGWIASMAGRPLAHGFDGFRVGPHACGTWSHSGLLSGVWSERAPAVSSPGCSASSLTPAQTREAHRQHKPRGQCGLAGGIGHPIGLWARRMPRSTGGTGHGRTPLSCPVPLSVAAGVLAAARRAAVRLTASHGKACARMNDITCLREPSITNVRTMLESCDNPARCAQSHGAMFRRYTEWPHVADAVLDAAWPLRPHRGSRCG